MDQIICNVMDRGATTVARIHDFRDMATGEVVPFRFAPNEFTKVPMRFAICVVGNEGFVVHTDDGQKLTQRVPKELTVTGKGLVMQPDQVVARLSELTTEALVARCAAQAGGDRLGKKPSRDAAIKFLLSAPDASPPAGAKVMDMRTRESFVQDGVTEVSV